MTFQRPNSVEVQALLEQCSKCGMPAGVWCKTRYDKFSDALHTNRKAGATDLVSTADLRAQVRRDADHAAQRATMSDPEGITP